MANDTPANSDAEFVDPLENYDPRQYDDPLQQSLCEKTVGQMHIRPFASVTADTSVSTAMEKLVGDQIACLLVEDSGKLVGVFSDRDVLDKVALEYDEVKDKPVSEVMTREPVYVYESDSAAAVLNVMAISGYRHVPVVNLDETLVGILSPNRMTQFLRENTGS
jgi:CBS domain-containing protein